MSDDRPLPSLVPAMSQQVRGVLTGAAEPVEAARRLIQQAAERSILGQLSVPGAAASILEVCSVLDELVGGSTVSRFELDALEYSYWQPDLDCDEELEVAENAMRDQLVEIATRLKSVRD